MKTHHKVGAVFVVIGLTVMVVGFHFNQYSWGMVLGLIGLVPFFLGISIVTSPSLNHHFDNN